MAPFRSITGTSVAGLVSFANDGRHPGWRGHSPGARDGSERGIHLRTVPRVPAGPGVFLWGKVVDLVGVFWRWIMPAAVDGSARTLRWRTIAIRQVGTVWGTHDRSRSVAFDVRVRGWTGRPADAIPNNRNGERRCRRNQWVQKILPQMECCYIETTPSSSEYC